MFSPAGQGRPLPLENTMPIIQFTRLDGASESVDLDHCIRHLVASPPRHKYDRDPSRVGLFARTPDGRWIQCNPSGGWHEEVSKSEVLEAMIEDAYWPIPAELLPEVPQVPPSVPAREATNPPAIDFAGPLGGVTLGGVRPSFKFNLKLGLTPRP